MREMLNSLAYKVEKVYLTKSSVEKLKIINPRQIHIGQVNSIFMALCSDEHFDVIIVVNQRGMRLEVIDGNHRIAALKKYFELYPDARIPVYFATYKNLNPDEQRTVFTKWNISVTQSTDDFINSYKETIPMFKRLTDEMPCSIYGSKSKMKLRDLINAYVASFEKPYHGGESKTKMDTVRYMQKLKDDDVEIIKKNFKILLDVFNSDKVKDWRQRAPFKNIIFRALYYLVSNNVNNLGKDFVIKRMKKVLANRALLDEFRRYMGRRASVDAYLSFKHLLNMSNGKKFV